MDWNNFDECYEKLRIVLRELVSDRKDANKIDIYGSYLDYAEEIRLVVQRIETEAQELMELTKKTMDMLRASEELDKALSAERFAKEVEKLTSLRLDIKSFFIFTRIFLDTLARIIGLCFDKKDRQQLPRSMTKLVGHKKLMELDSSFAQGLKDKILWFDNFRRQRVEIEHFLGSIRSTTMDEKFCFDILGSRIRRSWGSSTVASITDYMEGILRNLSELILHIHQRFQSVDTKT